MLNPPFSGKRNVSMPRGAGPIWFLLLAATCGMMFLASPCLAVPEPNPVVDPSRYNFSPETQKGLDACAQKAGVDLKKGNIFSPDGFDEKKKQAIKSCLDKQGVKTGPELNIPQVDQNSLAKIDALKKCAKTKGVEMPDLQAGKALSQAQSEALQACASEMNLPSTNVLDKMPNQRQIDDVKKCVAEKGVAVPEPGSNNLTPEQAAVMTKCLSEHPPQNY